MNLTKDLKESQPHLEEISMEFCSFLNCFTSDSAGSQTPTQSDSTFTIILLETQRTDGENPYEYEALDWSYRC